MKKVTLNKDSWHFKYYSSIVDDSPPKTLCPYFWTMVALIIFSPIIFLFRGILKLVDFLDIKKSEKNKVLSDGEYEKRLANKEKRNKILILIGKVIFWGFIGFFVCLILALLFHGVQKVGVWVIIRGFLLVIGFFTIAYHILKFVIDKSEYIGNFFKLKIFTLPIEMIVATYKKACPLVDWKTNETELSEVKV